MSKTKYIIKVQYEFGFFTIGEGGDLYDAEDGINLKTIIFNSLEAAQSYEKLFMSEIDCPESEIYLEIVECPNFALKKDLFKIFSNAVDLETIFDKIAPQTQNDKDRIDSIYNKFKNFSIEFHNLVNEMNLTNEFVDNL